MAQNKPEIALEGPGLIVARFNSNDQATVEGMLDLLELVKAESQRGEVGLLVLAEDTLRMVDFRVPVFWAEQVRTPAVRLRAIGVATHRRAVLAVVNGFAKTLEMLGVSTQVRAFETAADARRFLADFGLPRAA